MREEARRNAVKTKLAAGMPVIGSLVLSRSIANIEVLASLGFDFVLLDAEHFMKNPETIEHLIVAAEAAGITPLVRPGDDLTLSAYAVSAGARGILVPMCETREIAQRAVDLVKYPPVGKRGVCIPRAVTYGVGGLADIQGFYERENENILVLGLLESATACRNVTDILGVNGLDAFLIGQVDLSQSLGIAWQLTHPRLEETIARAFEAIKGSGKKAGIMAFDGHEATKRLEQGFDLIILAADEILLARGASAELEKISGRIRRG